MEVWHAGVQEGPSCLRAILLGPPIDPSILDGEKAVGAPVFLLLRRAVVRGEEKVLVS